MTSVKSLITPTSICLILDNQPYNIEKSHPNFQILREALKNKEYDRLIDLVDVPKAIHAASAGKVHVEGDSVFYGDEKVHGIIVERILGFLEEGLPFEPLARFLERLMNNPSKRAVDELYRFLEHKSMPIDDDGCFYAYKAVRSDFRDKHSGKFDNTPGNVVEMVRNQVDDDARHGCSRGLHAGSYKYATEEYGTPPPHGTDKIVLVKIDPADVVSVPFDSDCQKLRTWRYEVVTEINAPLSDNYYAPEADEDEFDEGVDDGDCFDVFDEDDEY